MKKYTFEEIALVHKQTRQLKYIPQLHHQSYTYNDLIAILARQEKYQDLFEISRILRHGYSRENIFTHTLELIKYEQIATTKLQKLVLKTTRKSGRFTWIIGDILMKGLIDDNYKKLIKYLGKMNDYFFLDIQSNEKYIKKFFKKWDKQETIVVSTPTQVKSKDAVIKAYEEKITESKIILGISQLPIKEFHRYRKLLRDILILHNFFHNEYILSQREETRLDIINREVYTLLLQIVRHMGKLHDIALQSEDYKLQIIDIPKDLQTLLQIYFAGNEK